MKTMNIKSCWQANRSVFERLDHTMLPATDVILTCHTQKELDLAFAAAGSVRAANGGSYHDDDDDEDDDEYEDEEGLFGAEQLFDTPLDKVDSYVIFGQVMQGQS